MKMIPSLLHVGSWFSSFFIFPSFTNVITHSSFSVITVFVKTKNEIENINYVLSGLYQCSIRIRIRPLAKYY